MKFIICDAEQGSPEWLADRVGCVTGTGAKNVLAKIKTGEAETRLAYKKQIASEMLNGTSQSKKIFVSEEMQWGTATEPYARAVYEMERGVSVRQTGFLKCAELNVGCSLDGDVNNFEGIIEIKCPNTITHEDYILSDKVPSNYMPQIIHNMWVTGAEWCDFMSYDPRSLPQLRVFIKRITRDSIKKEIDDYEKCVKAFIEEAKERCNQLLKRGK